MSEGAIGGDLRPVDISSIAGTSAGGINTLLAALVWAVKPESEGGFANRIGDNIFRDVWLLPDVNRLLPPRPDSPLYLPDDALLSRKDLSCRCARGTKKMEATGDVSQRHARAHGVDRYPCEAGHDEPQRGDRFKSAFFHSL
jgi:ABC-type phosphonate transport system ATPase subunit